MEGVKESLLAVISKLPQNIYIGLMCFNKNLFMYDFEDAFTKFSCLSGS